MTIVFILVVSSFLAQYYVFKERSSKLTHATMTIVFILVVSSFLVGSSAQTDDECEFTGRISFLAERGESTRIVNYTLPITETDVMYFPEPPVLLEEGLRRGVYMGNKTVCRFELYLKVLRCNISELQQQTNLILEGKCDDLVYGQTCLGYCPTGSVSTATPPSFTCESRDLNSTYWVVGQTGCSENDKTFKCPQNMTFYTRRSYDTAQVEWTLPDIADKYGQSWNITYQSLKLREKTLRWRGYENGNYTNIVGAVNSKGQTSSCLFGIEVKIRTCSVPLEEGAIVQTSRPDIAFVEGQYAKKVCKKGYQFPEEFRKRWNYLNIECVKNTTSGELYWKSWDRYACNRTYMPYTCENNIYVKDKSMNNGSYEFTYNMADWTSVRREGKSECSVNAKRTKEQTKAYNLDISFTTTNPPPREKCFFQVLLFTGDPGYNSPMKIFDCSLSESVKMKWPTSEFVLVFRLFDNFTENSGTNINGNGTINYKFTECTDCDYTSVTGLTEAVSNIPWFDYSPVAPCRLSACLEDALEGYKLRLHPQTKDARYDLYNERCETNIRLQSGVTKVCLRQTKPRQSFSFTKFDNECRNDADYYKGAVQIKFGTRIQLSAYCDDLLNWWCVPIEEDDNFLNISWKGRYDIGSTKPQLWIISVSNNKEGQLCSEPFIATTTPRPKKKINLSSGDDNRMTITIVGAVVSSLAAICTCLGGGVCCYKKRKKNSSRSEMDTQEQAVPLRDTTKTL